MNSSSRLSALMLITAGLFVLSGCDHQSPVSTTGHSSQAAITVIHLNQPVRVDQLMAQVQRDNLTVEEVQMHVGAITCGYTVAGRSPSSVGDEYTRQTQRFLSIMRDQKQLAATDQQALTALATQPMMVDVVAIRDAPVDVADKLNGVVRDDVIILPTDRVADEVPDKSSPSSGPSPQSYYHERWAPYGGASVVLSSYTYQEFLFNNLADYTSTRTYEHETQVYNKSFADYGGYWSSNLPNAYKDTPFGDSIDNFTVGCSRGDNLRTGVRYYTYMALRAGSASSSICRIRGQIGHRDPGWCSWTWCIWADATTYPGQLAYLIVPNYGFSWVY